MVSRRRFLALGPVFAATAASGPTTILKDILPKPSPPATGELSRSTFAPHAKSTFVIHAGALHRVETKLAAIDDLPGADRHGTDREAQFALRFEGPAAEPLTQGTYDVEHAALGRIALFLVPLGGHSGVRHYQAVFNRIGAAAAREG